jgi:hydroxyacyl-ACP dehydratase HTD2-like protein with hotdog domain
MSYLLRRFYTTTATASSIPAIPSAKEIAFQFLNKSKSLTQTRRQVLDRNQLHKLSLALGHDTPLPPNTGDRIPSCHHLVSFTPEQRQSELGLDGTDTTWNPEWPFTRRMWAGGDMEWIRGRGLKVGHEVKERTEIISAEAKKSKTGEEMVVVGVRKTYETEGGCVILIDKRYVHSYFAIQTPYF